MSYNVIPSNDKFVCAYAPSGHNTKKQLAREHFLEGLQEREREREREEIILKDFNCTMKKMGRKGRSKTQRLYRCDPNYTLSKVIVDNGLEYF